MTKNRWLTNEKNFQKKNPRWNDPLKGEAYVSEILKDKGAKGADRISFDRKNEVFNQKGREINSFRTELADFDPFL